MPDTPPLKSHGDYQALLAAVQADLERRGAEVVRVRMPVSRVVEELQGHDWPNDSRHRTNVIGRLGAANGEFCGDTNLHDGQH